jgi:uncharacterized repeat protein (TIGR03803 family)
VFKLDSAGTETVLHSFTGGADGASPHAGLIRDAQGNLYGTTLSGGASDYGTVFRVTATGTETVLYRFTGADGASPYAGLIRDAQGNLYGTTYGGGTYGNGTVFKVTLTGTETVLYSFTGGADGGNSVAGLIRDAQGNLYGTTQIGGAYGYGTAFKLTPTGTQTVLHSFSVVDGAYPLALIGDGKGIFYGVSGGGAVDSGKVFKLTLTGKEKVLYSFTGGVDGSVPLGIVRDPEGNLYGTTSYGGDLNGCNSNPPYGCGVVFKLTPTGTETILYSFIGGTDGQRPFAAPIRDAQGNLYGTTYFGGAYGYGTVFKVIP